MTEIAEITQPKTVTMKNKETGFTFIDLFAGIGGFHNAMHTIGGQCVFASEIDKFARQTYEENYKKWSPKIFENGNFNIDITDPKLDYNNIPEFDVLCGGFPCQAFSHAGLKKGFTDTRGTLFFNIEQIVKAKIKANKKDSAVKLPKVLFLENVKGLERHDKKRTYAIIKDHILNLGYEVREQVLNSKHFGVPQNRERIFIVAWNKKLTGANDFRHPFGITSDGKHIFEKDKRDELCIPVSVGDILLTDDELVEYETKEERTYTISQKLWDGHQRRKREHKAKGNGFGYCLFKYDSPYTSTISARYYKDGSEILIDQSHLDKRPRKLHPIEAARLQGYPVDHQNDKEKFTIPVSNAQAYKQFGNSVSVPVIKAIAKEIKKQLLSL